jgi:hypothetical protein
MGQGLARKARHLPHCSCFCSFVLYLARSSQGVGFKSAGLPPLSPADRACRRQALSQAQIRVKTGGRKKENEAPPKRPHSLWRGKAFGKRSANGVAPFGFPKSLKVPSQSEGTQPKANKRERTPALRVCFWLFCGAFCPHSKSPAKARPGKEKAQKDIRLWKAIRFSRILRERSGAPLSAFAPSFGFPCPKCRSLRRFYCSQVPTVAPSVISFLLARSCFGRFSFRGGEV